MAVTTNTTRMVVFDDPDCALSQRMLAMVRDLAAERGGMKVERVNVRQDPGRAMAHRVMTVPTTIVFVGGEERKRLCGLRSRRHLTRTLDRILAEQAVQAADRSPIQLAPVA